MPGSNQQTFVSVALRPLSVLLLWLAPLQLFAQITVTDVIYTFRAAEKPVHNVKVKNTGSDPIYVTVEADEMVRPGFDDEKRVPTKDLIVSPRHFSIPAGADRTVRLLLRKAVVDTQSVYRVRFMPRAKPFEDDKGGRPAKRVALQVLTGIGMLIFVDPKDPRPELAWERQGGTVRFTNNGNVNVYLADAKACTGINASSPEADLSSASCEQIKPPIGRLYPGNKKTVNIPAHKTLVVSRRVGEHQERLVIPAAG